MFTTIAALFLCTSLTAMEPYTLRSTSPLLHNPNTFETIKTIAGMDFDQGCDYISHANPTTQAHLVDISSHIPALCARITATALPPEKVRNITDYVVSDMHLPIKTLTLTQKLNKRNNSIAYDPHHTNRLACNTFETIQILDMTGHVVQETPEYNNPIMDYAFDPHHKNRLAYTTNNMITFWNPKTDDFDDLITAQHHLVDIAFSPHTPHQFFFIENDIHHTPKLWMTRLDTEKSSCVLFKNANLLSYAPNHHNNTVAIAFRSDSYQVQPCLGIIDCETHKQISSHLASCKTIQIAASPHDAHIYAGVGRHHTNIKLFDARKQTPSTIDIETHTIDPNTIDFSPHNTCLIALSTERDGTRFYDIRTRKLVHIIPSTERLHGDKSFSFDPHNEKRCAVSSSKNITFWQQNQNALRALNTLTLQKALHFRKFPPAQMSSTEFKSLLQM